jgi:SAM-dependent methyltransferase
MADAGMIVCGVDRSAERVRVAQERTSKASFAVVDLRRGLPFQSSCADLITASLSLHYFDRATTDRIVADIRRVLKPGGTLLCRVNVVGDTASLYGQGPEHEPDYFEVDPGYFKRFFTETSLRDTLAPHLDVALIVPGETPVVGHYLKQTLIARATRTD